MQAVSLDAIWGTFRAKVVRRGFAQDVGILVGANFVGAVVSFAQSILVARWLGPESYGVAALVMIYPGLVYTFFDARSTEASVKYLSEFHARGERDRALAMCKLGYVIDLAIASLAFLAVLVTARWAAHRIVHRPEAVWLMIVYTAAFISRALVGTSYAVMTTLGRFPLIAWVDTLTTFLRVALVIGLVLADWQIAGVVYGSAGAAMATGLLYGIIAYAMIRRTWGGSWIRGTWQVLKGRRQEIFSFLAYSDLNALLGIIPKQLDMVVLGYFRNPMEVGYYKLAKGLASAVGYLVGPLQSVTYPTLVRLWGVGDRQVLRQKVQQLALQVGLPLGLAVLASTLLMPFALPWVVGRTYRPAVAATQLLLASSATWLAFFWLRPLFMAKGNVRQLVTLSSLVGGLSLAAYPVIVSCWGYLGLSGWGVIMQLFGNGIALFWLSRGKTGR